MTGDDLADEKFVALQKKATSKKVVMKTMINFSKAKPEVTLKDSASLLYSAHLRADVEAGRDLFEAFQNQFPPEFEKYVESQLITSEVIRYALQAALDAHPSAEKVAERNARIKYIKQFGEVYPEVMQRWEAYLNDSAPTGPKKKTMSFFLKNRINDILDGFGNPLKKRTVANWLTKK